MNNEKRNKWIFTIIFLCVVIGARFITAYARQSPKEVRIPLLIFSMALVMIPFGFICRRNSNKKDESSKDRMFIFILILLVLSVGITFGGVLRLFIGVGAGFFAGFLIGRLIRKKTTEKYGDSEEADKILNFGNAKEKPSENFLESQDISTRKIIKKLKFIEAFSLLSGMSLALIFSFTNLLYNTCYKIHVHPGDGTLYFINSDPWMFAAFLMVILMFVFGYLSERIQPLIAGDKLDIWKEYKRIKFGMSKLANKFAIIFVSICFIASIISAFLYFDSYLKVTPNGVEYNRFFGLGAKFYRWNEIKSIAYYQKNQANSQYDNYRFYAEITFNDGSSWKIDNEDKRHEILFKEAIYYIASRKNMH